ncbi:MAG: glutamate racemase [Anaerolineaceae bacterium 4572_78]|nr:MAG: glutamate racemase [Anaerolineaceae bacterium 4572_78]
MYHPIGIFDSGVGGLTVWQHIIRHLPHESTIYVADSYHCPYGTRPAHEIISFSREIVSFLLKQECKLIVVACNTASAAALTELRNVFSVPIVGLEPAIKPAALATKTGYVGLLATEGTLLGTLFQQTSQRYTQQIHLHIETAHDLVPLIEAGELSGNTIRHTLHRYLEPMLRYPIDQLVLGCTHYPLLDSTIQAMVGNNVAILDSGLAVACQVERLLIKHDIKMESKHGFDSKHKFYTTGQPQQIRTFLKFMKYHDNNNIGQLLWRVKACLDMNKQAFSLQKS